MVTPVTNRVAGTSPTAVQTAFVTTPANLPKCRRVSQSKATSHPAGGIVPIEEVEGRVEYPGEAEIDSRDPPQQDEEKRPQTKHAMQRPEKLPGPRFPVHGQAVAHILDRSRRGQLALTADCREDPRAIGACDPGRIRLPDLRPCRDSLKGNLDRLARILGFKNSGQFVFRVAALRGLFDPLDSHPRAAAGDAHRRPRERQGELIAVNKEAARVAHHKNIQAGSDPSPAVNLEKCLSSPKGLWVARRAFRSYCLVNRQAPLPCYRLRRL